MIYDYHQLFTDLPEQSLIVTANRRLAAHLQLLHIEYQTAQHKRVWTTLDIIPLSAWLNRCWQFAQDTGHSKNAILLSPNQELLIWEKIIRQSNQAPLIEIENTAKLVQQAWDILQQWNAIDELNTCHHSTLDTTSFQQWIRQYKKEMKGYIGQNQLSYHLHNWFKHTSDLPKKIYFVGFTELTPAIKTLLKILEDRGSKIELCQPAKLNCTQERYVFKNTADEIQAMANWSKKLLLSSHSPEKLRIGCVVPNLTEIKNQVTSIFQETYYLQKILANENFLNENIFNISAGQPLQLYPIVLTALTVIDCLDGQISNEKICYLLRSPFLIEAESEQHIRAKTEAAIQNSGRNFFNLAELLPYLKPARTFSKIWQTIIHLANKHPQQSPTQWAQQWQALLKQVGWPGQRSLDSHEYQTVQRFEAAWLEWQQYHLITPKINFITAKEQFNKLCQTIVFQPRVPTAPIQILGTLEATGLTFDHLWIMGLDELAWPTHAKPNPFIPIYLQRKLNLPHCSAQRELTFCQDITNILINSSAKVIVSHADQNSDIKLLASPLIESIPCKDFWLSQTNQGFEQLINSTAEMVSFNDNNASPISQPSKVPGGARLFKLQAACPFRAFAELRLNARENRTRESIHYTQRGKLIHAVLQEFWLAIKTHEQLCELDDQSLTNHINNCFKIAWSNLKLGTETSLQFTIEQDRLLVILKKWLTYEKTRQPFTVIATEAAKTIELSEFNLTLSVIIDRIDQSIDNELIIIDYKTGEISTNVWFDERPDDLQLPLYLIASDMPISALAFGQLKLHKITFKGLTTPSCSLPNTKTLNDWPQQILVWQQQIQQLAQEFSSGYAKVQPKDPKQTCSTCHLSMLCRIHEVDQHCDPEVIDD